MVPWSFEFQTHINIALLLCRPQHFNMKTFQMFYTLQHKPTTMKDEVRRFKLVDHDFPIHQTELCPNRIKVISSGIRNTKQWSLITCPNNESTFPYFWCASHISATHRIASYAIILLISWCPSGQRLHRLSSGRNRFPIRCQLLWTMLPFSHLHGF